MASSSTYGQVLNVTSGTTSLSGQSYNSTTTGTAAVTASGTGVVDLSNSQATGSAARTEALYATGGGKIFMHGGTAALGDNATVVGYAQSPVVYASNGGSITLDQGAQVDIGQTAGNNALGNGVAAISTNGSATTVNLDDVAIVHNQSGYASGNTGRYMSASGAGASLVANNVTTSTATIPGQAVGGSVAVESGARMTITNSTLGQATAYNLASGTSGPATMLSISDTTIGSVNDSAIGVLGTSWVAANAVRGSTTLTDVSVVMGGKAANNGGVYGSGIYGAGVMADTTSDVAVHGGSITTAGTSSMGIEATDNSAGVAKGGAGAVTVDAAGAKGPTQIGTSGAGAYGAYANLGGTIAIAGGASIGTTGANADGLRATLGDALNPTLSTANVAPASITMTGGSVTTGGAGANGSYTSGAGVSTTLTDTTVSTNGAKAYGVEAAANGSATLSNVAVTVNGPQSTGLYATAGGSIAMHGGSATLGDGDTVVGYNHSPAVYAYNGGTIAVDQGAQLNMGQNPGTNAVGNGVQALSSNGTATQVSLDGVDINVNQSGYVSGNTRKYMLADGAGASIIANNVTTNSSSPTGAIVVDAVQAIDGGRITITDSSLNHAQVLNVASGTKTSASTVAIGNSSITSSGDSGIGVLGTYWDTSNKGTIRGSTSLTDTSVAVDGSVGSNGSVYTTGSYSAGVMADAMSDVAVHGGSISTSGTSSMGVEATDNSAGAAPGAGTLTVDAAGAKGPTQIGTSGAGAYGAYANLGGTIAIAGGASIGTTGANADGLRATLGDALNPTLSTANVAPASITMTGGSVTTTGTGANGVSLDGGTSVSLNGVAVNAAASGLSITDANQSGKTNTVAIAAGSLASKGDAFAVNGANAAISVSGTAPITPGSGNLLSLSKGAAATFTAAGVTLNGNIVSDAASSGDVYLNSGTVLTGMVDPVSMTIDAGSRWNITASSVATDLSNAGTIAFAAPADPDNAAGYSTLTARNYVGNNGTIVLNTKLGADNSSSDKLIIDGGAATGSTTLLVKNTNGAGAATASDGIMLVDAINGATTSPGAFKLGSAVSAGAYDYNLYYQNLAKSDQNWYLRSIATPDGPALSPAAQTALPYADVLSNFAQATLGTLQQRTGNRIWTDGLIDGRGAWGRVVGQYSSYDPKTGSPYTQRLGFLQAGYEGVAARKPAGELTLGAYATAGTSSAHIDVTHDPVTGAARPGGKITSTGTGLGVNATWLGKNGFYTDAIGQFTWYDSDLSNKSGSGNQGWSGAASLELGKRFDLGSGWALVPQTQLAWTHVDFDSYTDNSGNRVSLGKGDSLQGRIGVRVEKQSESAARSLQLYGVANLEYEFLNGTSVQVSGTTLDQRNQRLWGEVGAGATYAWNKNWSLYAEADYATALSGASGGNYAVRATAGLRYRW